VSRLFFPPQAVRIDSAGTPYASATAAFHLTGTTTDTDTFTDNARSVAHANPVVADSAGQFAAIYLVPSVTYRCIIKDSAGATLDDIDPVHAPIISSDVTSVDAGGYFAGTEVETILQDIGANYGKKTATGTWTATQTFSSANIAMADNAILRPEFTDFSITHTVVTQSTSTPDFDCTASNSFVVTLTENATFSLSNPSPDGKLCQIVIKIIQDASAGAYTVAWPASVDWPGGTAPVISTGNSAVDRVTLSTIDAGTTWYGDFSQAYA